MSDNVLEIGARVNASGVQSGMQEAAGAVESGTQRMTSSMQRYAQQLTQTRAAQQQTVQATAEMVQATNTLTTTVEAAAPAMQQLSNGLKQVQSSGHAAVTEIQATSGAIRLLEGNGGIRAIERFVATTLGLGGAFQALFPLIGAVGLLGLVVHFGEELYNAFDLGGKRARKTAEDIRDVNHEIQTSTDSLDVQIDKLQQEQAKLEKKPFNGTKLVLDEAAEAADRLAGRLDGVIKKELETVTAMSASMPQRLLGGIAGVEGGHTEYEQTMLKEHTKWLMQQKDVQGELNESISYGNSLQIRQKDLQTKESSAPGYYTKELHAIQEMIRFQAAEQGNIQKEVDLTKQERATQGARDKHDSDKLDDEAARKAAEAQEKAQEAALKGMELRLARMKQNGEVTAVAEFEYWTVAGESASLGEKQYEQVQEKLATLAVEGARRAHEMIAKFKSEAARSDREAEEEHQQLMKAQDQAPAKAAEAWAPFYKLQMEGAEIQAKGNQELEEANLKAAEARGGISRLSAAHQEAQIHARALSAELAALNKQLAAEQAKAPTDYIGNVTDPKAAAEIQRLKNEIAQLQNKGNAQGVGDQSGIAQAAAAPYRQATQEISSGLSGALSTWERGQGTFVQAWGKSLGSMVMQLQASVLRMTMMWALHYAQQRAMHTAAAVQQAATDTTAAATAKATSAAQATTQGQNAAITAAKNTYASVSAVPVVGPVLAPIAAAGAFAAVAMFGMPSAQGGWESVPADNTIANLHKNEMVLPAHLAEGIRNMTGGGSTIHQNFGGNTIHGSGEDFGALLDKHEDKLADKMKSLHRDGKIG